MNDVRKISVNSLNVQEYYKKHKDAFGCWKEGEPTRAYYDEDNILCIEYKSGNWWHYRIKNNNLQWW